MINIKASVPFFVHLPFRGIMKIYIKLRWFYGYAIPENENTVFNADFNAADR